MIEESESTATSTVRNKTDGARIYLVSRSKGARPPEFSRIGRREMWVPLPDTGSGAYDHPDPPSPHRIYKQGQPLPPRRRRRKQENARKRSSVVRCTIPQRREAREHIETDDAARRAKSEVNPG
ncbi:hypothetical protein MRX96_029447 [Rhipicephalus microplus]